MTTRHVSVVTIARNEASTIARTLDSIHEQSYGSFESIVVDGGSEDETYSIAEQHPVAPRMIRQSSSGISNAFNEGARAATGDFVLFLNAGDWLLDRDAITSLMSAASSNPGAEIVTGRARLLAEGTHAPCGTYPPEPPSLARLDRYCSIAHPATVVAATAFRKVGLFDTSFRVAMDYELWLRCRAAGIELAAIDREISAHVRGGISTTNKARARRENVRARRQNGVRKTVVDSAHLLLSLVPARGS